MFGEPGRAYVYFIYGMYEMLNFVTERKGYPGAVLIRALEPLTGEELMGRRRRGQSRSHWTNGPGRLCRALGIRMSHNGLGLVGPEIQVVDDGFVPEVVHCSPRIGISAATEVDWRYYVAGNPFVSKAKENLAGKPVMRQPRRRSG
jgi:DNA-3-methyladenine glycosylase